MLVPHKKIFKLIILSFKKIKKLVSFLISLPDFSQLFCKAKNPQKHNYAIYFMWNNYFLKVKMFAYHESMANRI